VLCAQSPSKFAKELRGDVAPHIGILSDDTYGATTLGRRLMLARLKPQMQGILQYYELTWEETLPCIELVDSYGKMKEAIDIDHVEDFVDELASAAAPVVRTQLIKQARLTPAAVPAPLP
jgi:hypothetical protein